MINFAVIGIAHSHIYGQVKCLLDAGARFVTWFSYSHEAELDAKFGKTFPQAARARSEEEILERNDIQLVVTATVPADRAALSIRAMRHGKDVMSDKPGATTLAQLAELRTVQTETKRIYSICYSERFENRATVKASQLVREGAIGRVLQTVGLGPHRRNFASRLPYFFERERYGGILCDIASHQFDQFLFFTGCVSAEIVASQVGNLAHPHLPGFEDFGDVMLRGETPNGSIGGYVRVDWFTPDGLPTWGDGRLTILGTEGYIEVRKYLDLGGRAGGDHLFLVDSKRITHIDCSQVNLPYGAQLVHDVLNRTETAMSQQHCFWATELALKAQAMARRL
jgi:predicted dehydrogenase